MFALRWFGLCRWGVVIGIGPGFAGVGGVMSV